MPPPPSNSANRLLENLTLTIANLEKLPNMGRRSILEALDT